MGKLAEMHSSTLLLLIVTISLHIVFSTALLVPPTVFWGTRQSIEYGSATPYVQIVSENPVKLGLRADFATIGYHNIYKETTNYFDLPSTFLRAVPFVEIDYNIKRKGEKPKEDFERPLVKIFFFLTTKGGSLARITPFQDKKGQVDCGGLSVEGWCRSATPLPEACCPEGWTQVGDSLPFVGSELHDPNFEGPLTKTFVWGVVNGMINFFQIKVSIDHLKALENGTLASECLPIPNMPSEFKSAGDYPTTWCVNYNQNAGAFEFELQDFTFISAGCKGKANSCKLDPQKAKKLDKKCDCKKYPPYPKFIAVAPPASTGMSTTGSTSSATGTMGSMSMGSMSMGTATGSGSMGSMGSMSMSSMSSGSSSSMNSMSMGSKSSSSSMNSMSMGSMGSSGSMGSMGSMGSSSMGTMGSSSMGMGSMSGMMMTGYLRFLMDQGSIHDLYMVSLAIIGFFFLIIAFSFSLYGTTVVIALCRAQKNNLNLSLILKMVFITLLLTCIFAARCALIIWEDIVMRHDVDSEYLWISYFLPEIIPALLILGLDFLQILGEKKKALLASMATLGFTTKSKTTSTKSVMSGMSGMSATSATQKQTTAHSSSDNTSTKSSH